MPWLLLAALLLAMADTLIGLQLRGLLFRAARAAPAALALLMVLVALPAVADSDEAILPRPRRPGSPTC